MFRNRKKGEKCREVHRERYGDKGRGYQGNERMETFGKERGRGRREGREEEKLGKRRNEKRRERMKRRQKLDERKEGDYVQ